MAERKEPNRWSAVAGTRRLVALLAFAVIAIVVALVTFSIAGNHADRQQRWSAVLTDVQSTAADITQAGAGVSAGLRPDFALIASDVVEFDDGLRTLRKGDAKRGIPALPKSVGKSLDELTANWAQMKQQAGAVTALQKVYDQSVGFTASIVGTVPTIQALYDASAKQLLGEANASRRAVYLASTQLARLQQIADAARAVGARRSKPSVQAQALADRVNEFEATNQKLAGAGDAYIRSQVGKARTLFQPNVDASAKILANGPKLDRIVAAGKKMYGIGTTRLLPSVHDVRHAVTGLGRHSGLFRIIAYVAAALALVALIAFAVIFVTAQIARRRAAEARDRKQQQAILGLLDEITNLADGDLTVDISVTEDFTGAIADSINYTVQTLRSLVGTINRTSERIATSAGDTRESVRTMSEASDRQAREITDMTQSITGSSSQLQYVAARAEALAEQAQGSVRIAHTGAETVGHTIKTMTALREQIQDTAKRIKRLGESSQEIGNITEFIDDIADQTNTLALNASIQAAMAGEAGRGFAVVAGEVQRLAERAGSATRRIEGLVKAIQADTGEAIVSMDRSTGNVVAGAQSAEEAGRALGRIETASQELAKTIAEISGAAREQSASTTRIADSMQGIRQIAVETSGSARQTSTAVGELNTLSDQLRESVAGFKLPAEEAADPA